MFTPPKRSQPAFLSNENLGSASGIERAGSSPAHLWTRFRSRNLRAKAKASARSEGSEGMEFSECHISEYAVRAIVFVSGEHIP